MSLDTTSEKDIALQDSSLEEDMTKARIGSSSSSSSSEQANGREEYANNAPSPKDNSETNDDNDDGNNNNNNNNNKDNLSPDPEDDDSSTTSSSSSSSSANNDTKSKSKIKNDDPMTLLTKALTHKEEGNALFKSQKFTQASRTYKKGINIIKHLHNGTINSPSNDEQVTSLLLSLQSNLCMVYYKLENYTQCHSIAEYILTKIDSENSKAYYRRGLCHYKMKRITNAKQDLYKAYTLNPKDKAIVKEYRIVKKEYDNSVQKQQKEKERQKKALAKALGGGGGGSNVLYSDREEELKRKQEKQKQKEEEERLAKEKRKQDWEDDCVKRMSNGEDVVTFEEYEKEIKKKEEEEEKARKKARKDEEEEENRRREEERRKRLAERKKSQEDAGDSSDDDNDDILTESELQSLRGYKKTSDGRTTSYFTREQTEEEKKLLGSIAPKKLESPSVIGVGEAGANGTTAGISGNAASAPQRLDSSMSSSSAWNQAGTWEEKDTSEWCNKSLEKYLKLAKVTTSTSTSDNTTVYEASVTKVKDLKGDASVAFVSGKKRYVFDYSADLTFQITASDNCSQEDDNMDVDDVGEEKIGKKSVVARGSLSLPDISSTSISDEEIEVQMQRWKKEPRDQYKDSVMKCSDDLINQVREQVFAFVREFNSQY